MLMLTASHPRQLPKGWASMTLLRSWGSIDDDRGLVLHTEVRRHEDSGLTLMVTLQVFQGEGVDTALPLAYTSGQPGAVPGANQP